MSVGISRGKRLHDDPVHLIIDDQGSFACSVLNYNGYVIELHYTQTTTLTSGLYILQGQAKLARFFLHFLSVQERIP